MLHMVDMYLHMNLCLRDKDNNVYYNNDGKCELVGKLKSYEIKDGVLTIIFESKEDISFINIEAIIE